MTHPLKELWKKRFEIEKAIKEQLWAWDYQETRTPLLVQSPGMEPHICPIEIKGSSKQVFLPTSPEFAMKKLLARGLPRIFQICSSFRNEPTSPEHQPEFSMLEFYETDCTIEEFQTRVEKLIQDVAQKIGCERTLSFRGQKISIHQTWPRFRIVDLFQKALGIDLRIHTTSASLAKVCLANGIQANENEPWDDLYFKLWLNKVEPTLPKNQICFVTHYPVSQSSLCNRVTDETGFEWASRFEMYVGSFELGNAFDELRNPVLQRANFEHDQQTRREIYGNRYPESPIDEELIAAITMMKPTCGIAIGLDRLCMLLLDADKIEDVLPLKPYW